MSKSFVTLEQAVCPICREEKDTGALLLDRRMRDTFEHKTTTGFAVCSTCQDRIDDGYIALVGANPDKSVIIDDTLKPEDAHYIAEYLWLKRHVAVKMFNIDVEKTPFVYIDQEAINKVKEIVANASE